jgi:hypothetical protein
VIRCVLLGTYFFLDKRNLYGKAGGIYMTWSLSPERRAGSPVWVKRLGDVYLSVYRSCETHTQWKWKVQYGIATAIGYAKTVRAAKIRATRVAKQYADQFDV